VRCLDAFHAVAWATKALDEVRRGLWNDLRRTGKPGQANTLKGGRWALLKNPEDLTADQRTTLAGIAEDNQGLYRGYLLKEQLRALFQVKGRQGKQLLAGWLAWGQTLPAAGVRQTRPHHRQVPAADLEHPGPRHVQRPGRGDEHAPARVDPTRLRLPLRRCPDRDGHAHQRRPMPRTTRTRRMIKTYPREWQETPKPHEQHGGDGEAAILGTDLNRNNRVCGTSSIVMLQTLYFGSLRPHQPPAHVRELRADATMSPYSDHDPVRGSVTVRG